jgi:hypothetical protein
MRSNAYLFIVFNNTQLILIYCEKYIYIEYNKKIFAYHYLRAYKISTIS